jgi:hypothetical protein
VTTISEQGEKEDRHASQKLRPFLHYDVVNVGAAESTTRPDPEVVSKAKRRRFTGAYKQRILSEADTANTTGLSEPSCVANASARHC